MVQETFQGLEQIKAWFIGPLAENREFCKKSFADIIESYLQWRTNYGDDRGIITEDDIERNEPSHRQLKQLLNELLQELKSNFPFYSPRYIGHMLSEQTIPAMLGYFAAMLYNPNNVTPQAAPVTAKLEIEVGNLVSGMLGFDTKKSWTHICSGGTIANLEAFWAARAVQFLPLCLKHACDALKINLIVNNPNGRNTNLLKTPDKVLLCLRPDTALSLAVAFESAVSKRNDIDKQYLQKVIEDCEFNPRSQGLYTVCKKLKMNPVIFVSSAAHYSIAKAAHVLGYGEMAVKSIPVDSKFRIDLTELQDHLSKLKPTEWVAGVVGIVGTTEEGAVDSIDQIVGIREEYEKEQNRSFWIHIDAAWGGYFASVFRKDSRDHSWSDRAVRTVV
ncbi:MAG TPA: pyridoxal-dependent decarboxylase, partial [bacterium]